MYLAEIDYQWAEKAVSGLKDKWLTHPHIGRLVRSLAAVLAGGGGVRKGYSEVLTTNWLRMLPKNFAQYADGSVRVAERFGPGSGAVVISWM